MPPGGTRRRSRASSTGRRRSGGGDDQKGQLARYERQQAEAKRERAADRERAKQDKVDSYKKAIAHWQKEEKSHKIKGHELFHQRDVALPENIRLKEQELANEEGNVSAQKKILERQKKQYAKDAEKMWRKKDSLDTLIWLTERDLLRWVQARVQEILKKVHDMNTYMALKYRQAVNAREAAYTETRPISQPTETQGLDLGVQRPDESRPIAMEKEFRVEETEHEKAGLQLKQSAKRLAASADEVGQKKKIQTDKAELQRKSLAQEIKLHNERKELLRQRLAEAKKNLEEAKNKAA